MMVKKLRGACAALVLLGLSVGTARAELVGWWTFDDVAAGTVPDSSGFMNNGTLEAGATTSDDVPDVLAGGRSLLLGGFDDHVLVEHDDSLNILEAMTIAAWVKPTGNVEWDGIVAKSPSDGSDLNHAGNYELRIENGSRTMTFLNQQGGMNDTIPYTGGPSIVDSMWQHVAVTVDPDGVTFYRNGQLHSTRPLGGAMFFGEPNTNPLYIGSRADLFTTMDGLIDDLRIYNTVLSADEILDISGFDPPPPPPSDLLTVTIHSVSSELTTSFNRGAENLVNGNGLNADGTHAIGPDGNMWLNAGNGCCGDEPDPLLPGAEIVFDLGSVTPIDRMQVWNYNENLPGRPELLLRGVALADILVAGEDLNFTPFASDVEFEIAPGDELTEFGQVIDMAGTNARYVKLSLLANHGGDNDFLGLSEVQFFGSSLSGDFNGDGVLDATDIDLLTAEMVAGTNSAEFDLTGDSLVNADDHAFWLADIKKIWPGDADMNGLFNTSDFVQVFSRGQYEDAVAGNSGWGDGDWNGDQDFNSGDLVAAFQEGGFEAGPRPASGVQAVPEPASAALLLTALLGLGTVRRRS